MKIYQTAVIALATFLVQLAYADDTEIYRSTSNRVNPNVIFLIDTSGSMAYKASANSKPSSGEKNRLDIVKKAAKTAVKNLDPALPINIAVMRFDQRYAARNGNNGGAYGGYVTLPFTATESETNKNKIVNNINEMALDNIGGGTPITESLYEAYLYMTGKTPVFGKRVGEGSGISTSFSGKSLSYGSRSNIDIGSVAASIQDGKYKTPVTATCQKNHIVLFTDGMASSDEGANTYIGNLVSNMTFPSGLSKTCDGASGCAVPFAYFLHNTDHFEDSTLSGQNDENAAEVMQRINLHVVGGFAGITDTAAEMLNNAALYGHPLTEEHYDVVGGELKSKHYYKSDDEEGLTNALLEVFGGIANTAGNFAAPAVAVNAFNSLEHRDELYYSIFKPTELPGWSGNLKRFKMSANGTILDSKGASAIDPETGSFKESSQSFWSTEVDGAIVTKGGMANKMPATRNVYTNLSTSNNIISDSNKIIETNNSITANMLNSGLPAGQQNISTTQRSNILKWARGLDPVTNQARRSLADPLHGTPVVVSYSAAGNTLKDTLFMGTNVGYIHAFDTNLTSPSELWAFMPKELLPNLAIYQMGIGNVLKAYGMDGPMSVYHQDTNKNRIIDTGEKAYLTAGMRRGGRSYYLLDVSDRDNPKYVTQINGGSGDFIELGQTWSKMIPAKVKWNGQEIPVYFFGGGYDPQEDNYTQRTAHSQGNAIYMVAADSSVSGKKPFDLLWKITGRSSNTKGITNSSMTSSFASDLTLVDNNGDGTVDLIYAADVGGRLWRVDISAENTNAANFASAGIIADFNDGTVAGNIRFYTRPDVIYTEYGNIEVEDPQDSTKTILQELGRYQISIGSGFRAGPLSTSVNDKIFIVNDYDIEGKPENGYTKLTLSSLANHASFSAATAEQRKNGFYYQLPGLGEKVLSSSLTLNDTVYVTTFRPSEIGASQGCEPDVGKASLIKISTMNPATTTERSVETLDLQQGGIVPSPVLIFTASDDDEQGKPVLAVGTEVFDGDGDLNLLEKVYWRAK